VRLKELRRAGLVERSRDGYSGSAAGLELYKMLRPLGAWSKRWAERIAQKQ